MDQVHLSWIAPRIAAKIQERLYNMNPQDIKGYVREMEDGSIMIDNMTGKLPARRGYETYQFTASFEQISSGGGAGVVANAAFHLTVEVNFLDGGERQAVKYQTIVLRKLDR